jgi:hypothetical protein
VCVCSVICVMVCMWSDICYGVGVVVIYGVMV